MMPLKYVQRLKRWMEAGGVCFHDSVSGEKKTIAWADNAGLLSLHDTEPCCRITAKGSTAVLKAMGEHQRHGTWREVDAAPARGDD